MGVPIEVYRVRIGCFYDRASKCKNKQQIDILTAIFANLLLCYGPHAVVIVLCIQLNNNYAKANNDVTNCVFVTQKFVSQKKLYTYHHCVTYSYIPCYLVPLSIVIVLCTILLIISGSVHVNPGPVVDNSYMSSYCSYLDSNTSTHGYCTNPKDMSSDFKFYLSLIHLNIQIRSLKFSLDRRTLQIMYFSFIRPTLEYGDMIWNNCPLYYKDKVEKVNLEAARIVTGATKLVSLQALYKETGWENLEARREKHKLIQFFKIINGLTPEYLQQLVPPQHFQRHSHNTRHSDNFVNINCRTTYRHNSFIPSTIRLWNNLPAQLKQCNTLLSFKGELCKHYQTVDIPNYFFCGSRLGQILHARLRMHCSSLKQHLYLKNIEPDPHCICGGVETTEHFLLYCKNYERIRRKHFDSLNINISTNLLLFGNKDMNDDFNEKLFITVQKYIIETKRFS